MWELKGGHLNMSMIQYPKQTFLNWQWKFLLPFHLHSHKDYSYDQHLFYNMPYADSEKEEGNT